MSLKILNILSAALLAGLLAMAASPASGDPLGRSVIAGGIAVYFGIMPAEVLPAHPGRYPRHEGSKIPAGKNVYHVLLALFDHATGARITDADVVATVAPPGLAGARKRLDATTVAGGDDEGGGRILGRRRVVVPVLSGAGGRHLACRNRTWGHGAEGKRRRGAGSDHHADHQKQQ